MSRTIEEEEEVTRLLNRAAGAQLHNYLAPTNDYGVYAHWMRDRQQLTDLIAELANIVRSL